MSFKTKEGYGVLHYKFKTKPVIPTVIPKEKLKTITVPVLMLMGEEEIIYNPKKAVASAKECIPHIDIKMIANTSHCLFLEKADSVNQYMADFLDQKPKTSKSINEIGLFR